jgi:hypothetical protein
MEILKYNMTDSAMYYSGLPIDIQVIISTKFGCPKGKFHPV